MNIEHYRMAKSFAGEYGVFLGISWSITFCLMAYGMAHISTIPMLAGIFLYFLLPVIACYLSWRFKQHLPYGDNVSYPIAFMFVFLMFTNSCLITAAVEFCYFKFIDQGLLLATLKEITTSPEIAGQYRQMGMSQILDSMNQSLDLLAGMSPFDLVIYLFSNNLLTSLILCLPTAYIAHRKSRKIR